jgi:hypothetical protein
MGWPKFFWTHLGISRCPFATFGNSFGILEYLSRALGTILIIQGPPGRPKKTPRGAKPRFWVSRRSLLGHTLGRTVYFSHIWMARLPTHAATACRRRFTLNNNAAEMPKYPICTHICRFSQGDPILGKSAK